MTKQVNTWAPTLKDNDEPALSLMVECGPEIPTERQYFQFLSMAVDQLVSKDPKQARKDIQEVSDQDSPGLSFILAQYQRQEWAVQIMMSPQMAMLLHQIDWQKTNPVQKQPVENLPSLQDILMMLP
jgi:hypothetical protein